MMSRLNVALLIALAPLAACAGDATTVGQAHVLIRFMPAPGGTFTANVNGKTFTSAGRFAIDLPSLGTTYEVTGSFTGSLGVDFATTTAAGVQIGSVTSLE